MTIMRIAPAQAQALPSTIDERRAKIPKASLTTQKKSRDSSRCLSLSSWVSTVIIFWSPRATRKQRLCVPHKELRSRTPAACHRLPPLTTENQTKHETDPERGKDRFHRVLADVLLAVVLKTADAMERIIPYLFHAAPIFIDHCARGRAEIFHRFAGVRHATLCFFSRLRRNRRALIHLVF